MRSFPIRGIHIQTSVVKVAGGDQVRVHRKAQRPGHQLRAGAPLLAMAPDRQGEGQHNGGPVVFHTDPLGRDRICKAIIPRLKIQERPTRRRKFNILDPNTAIAGARTDCGHDPFARAFIRCQHFDMAKGRARDLPDYAIRDRAPADIECKCPRRFGQYHRAIEGCPTPQPATARSRR